MNDYQPLQIDASIASYVDIESFLRPAFSSDGKLFAYLSDASGTHQLWSRPPDGGAPVALTRMDEPVGNWAFSPCSHDLIFTMDCGGDERHQLWLLREGADNPVALTSDPTTVHVWGCWSPDGTRIAYGANARDKTQMDIYVMDLRSGAAMCVHQGAGYQDPLAFFSDGESLLLRDWTGGPHNQTLQRLTLDGFVISPLLPHDGRAEYRAVRMRRDGTGFYVLCDQESDHFRIGFVPLSGGPVQWLISVADQTIDAMALAADQQRMAYVVNAGGWNHVHVRNLASGEDRCLQGLPAGVVSSLSWIPEKDELIFPFEGAATPPSIWKADVASNTAAAFISSAIGTTPLADFVEPELIHVASFDGLQVPCFVYRPRVPADASGYPVVVIVHGGPAMAWTANFRADVQYLLARGVMVVGPNVRGSSGYGRSYHELDDKHLRMDSVSDLQAVRLWLDRQSEVDSQRVAVFGRSYGGFMVLAALTEYPESWRLGVDFYGIANFHTLLQTTGPWRRDLRAAEYGDPSIDAELLERISPIHRMNRLNAPLLIVHGLDDPRVTPGESEMLHSVVRGLGKPVQYLRIPHEGHGFARRSNRHIVYAALDRFLDRYL
jgi:dipeptidyl aminopeptidase/acylaminoacyl peptidase